MKEVKINKFLHDYKRLFKLFYGDGDRIGMNVETSVEVWCQMYFEMFPLDTQVKIPPVPSYCGSTFSPDNGQ